jgi:hypothetical protein
MMELDCFFRTGMGLAQGRLMEETEKLELKLKLKLNLYLSGALLAIGCWAPIYALIFPRPESELAGVWLQRSGSLMTVCALLAAHLISGAKSSITPAGFGWVGLNELRAAYLPRQNKFEVLSLVIVLIGTLIWGYGDLLL